MQMICTRDSCRYEGAVAADSDEIDKNARGCGATCCLLVGPFSFIPFITYEVLLAITLLAGAPAVVIVIIPIIGGVVAAYGTWKFIYKLQSKMQICPAGGQPSLVSLDSERGQAVCRRNH